MDNDKYKVSEGVKILEDIDRMVEKFTKNDWDAISKSMDLIVSDPDALKDFMEFSAKNSALLNVSDADVQEYTLRRLSPELYPDL